MITWTTGDTLRAVDLNGNFADCVSLSSSRTITATHQWNASQAFDAGLTAGGPITVTSTSASALAVGRQGATDPVLQVDASTALTVTGLKIKGAAAGGGVALSAISSATNENLTVDAKGSGTITFGGTSTGANVFARASTFMLGLTVSSGTSALQAVTATTITATGDVAVTGTGAKVVSITSADDNPAIELRPGGTAADPQIRFYNNSGTNTHTIDGNAINLIVDLTTIMTWRKKSDSTVLLTVADTGALTATSSNASALAVGRQGATNPVLLVDASTASVATGLKVKGAAAAAGLALSVITSGTDENLTIDAAGAGTVTVGGTSTGSIALSRATAVTGNLTLSASVILSASAPQIRSNTTDGSDTKQVTVAGGGAAGQTRGGYVTFSGNEHASTGKVEILAGDVTGGTIDFYTLGAQVAQFDRSVTATHARFLVYCVDTATMERVKTGPAASGPGGSGRALYVA